DLRRKNGHCAILPRKRGGSQTSVKPPQHDSLHQQSPHAPWTAATAGGVTTGRTFGTPGGGGLLAHLLPLQQEPLLDLRPSQGFALVGWRAVDWSSALRRAFSRMSRSTCFFGSGREAM